MSDNRETLDEALKRLEESAKQYETCMSLHVNERGQSVSLFLDTSVSFYLEHIPGEGADIGIYRCHETNQAVGVTLPLMNERLCVHYEGPMRVNAGFRKIDQP